MKAGEIQPIGTEPSPPLYNTAELKNIMLETD